MVLSSDIHTRWSAPSSLLTFIVVKIKDKFLRHILLLTFNTKFHVNPAYRTETAL